MRGPQGSGLGLAWPPWREGADHAVATIELGGSGQIRDPRAGHVGLRLVKTTGSAFTKFARDETTTLPERIDRPLFIHLDIHWRDGDPADALGPGHVDSVAVRASALRCFDGFVSESIQYLVHEMVPAWPDHAEADAVTPSGRGPARCG